MAEYKARLEFKVDDEFSSITTSNCGSNYISTSAVGNAVRNNIPKFSQIDKVIYSFTFKQNLLLTGGIELGLADNDKNFVVKHLDKTISMTTSQQTFTTDNVVSSFYSKNAQAGEVSVANASYFRFELGHTLRTWTIYYWDCTWTYTAPTYRISTYVVADGVTGAGGTATGGGVFEVGIEDKTVTLVATPASGYRFKHWSDGDGSVGTNSTLTVTISQNNISAFESSKTYTAFFEKMTYALTAMAGEGGTVSGGGTYEHGATATLKATPNAGYKFVKWSDGVTTATRTVTVTAEATYTAVFEKTYYTLNYMSHEDGLYASVQEQSGVEMTLTYDLSSKIVSTYFRANYQGGEIQEVISYLVNNGWEDWNTIVASNGETFTGEQFDAPYYANKHSDLLNAFGYNKQSLVNHWANYGRNENRKAVDANARSTYPIGATVNLAAKEGDVIELYTQFGEAIEPVVFPSITRDGFKFLGWYDKPTGGNKIGDAGYTYMPTDLKNFYAHWEADPPKFADAQMLYNGKIVSSNNKVPAGQSFILKCKLE